MQVQTRGKRTSVAEAQENSFQDSSYCLGSTTFTDKLFSIARLQNFAFNHAPHLSCRITALTARSKKAMKKRLHLIRHVLLPKTPLVTRTKATALKLILLRYASICIFALYLKLFNLIASLSDL